MMEHDQARELLESFISQGETLDPDDMSVLYGWIFSASVAIQPFPPQHKEFCDHCRNSFDPPRQRLEAGLLALRRALQEAESGVQVEEKNVSAEYWRLLHRALKKETR
jgi:hypothetical protein